MKAMFALPLSACTSWSSGPLSGPMWFTIIRPTVCFSVRPPAVWMKSHILQRLSSCGPYLTGWTNLAGSSQNLQKTQGGIKSAPCRTPASRPAAELSRPLPRRRRVQYSLCLRAYPKAHKLCPYLYRNSTGSGPVGWITLRVGRWKPAEWRWS